jgi:preprotein translocase subunit SecG
MTLLLILIIIISIALILFVLIQNPKGGGLNSEFGSASQLGGAKRATDILEKGTWGLAIVLAVLCLLVAPNYIDISNTKSDNVEEIGVDIDQATTEQQTAPAVNIPTQE